MVACLIVGCSNAAETEVPGDVGALIERYGITPEELDDIRFVADENGWTLREGLDRLAWQQGFAVFVQELRDQYPDQFANAKILSQEGARSVMLAFSGEVPPSVLDDGRLEGLDVEFRADQGFTEKAIVAQTEDVYFALLDAGFPDAQAYADLDSGVVVAYVVRRATDVGKPDTEVELPDVARAGNVSITFVDELPESGLDR